jgi:hypothetical protein
MPESKDIWVVAMAAFIDDGEIPCPVGLSAVEVSTGDYHWQDLSGENGPREPPRFIIDERSTIVTYFGSIEAAVFRRLNWPMPSKQLDLFAEFRCKHNGRWSTEGYTYEKALAIYEVDNGYIPGHVFHGDYGDRPLPVRGAERSIRRGSKQFVSSLAALYQAMREDIDNDWAPFRGRYMQVVGEIESNGIPMDVDLYNSLLNSWSDIIADLIRDMDDIGVYEEGHFRTRRFENYLNRKSIPWPKLPSGELALDSATFKAMAGLYPQLEAIGSLRTILSKFRALRLSIGKDGRNRSSLAPFRSKTGRNQPSSTRFIFGAPSWLRRLVKPQRGKALAYIDYEQQEFGIAAALSRDPAMMAAYESGDPYLAFAKDAGAIPPEGTRSTHPKIREIYKECCLAVMYGMGAESFAMRTGLTPLEAKDILSRHQRTYTRFWRWCTEYENVCLWKRVAKLRLGWRLILPNEVNLRSLRNFPMQGNGAGLLQLLLIMLSDAQIKTCAPVHDAVLMESDVDEIEEKSVKAQKIMERAGEIIFDGFRLRTDCTIIAYPHRFEPGGGEDIWELVTSKINPELIGGGKNGDGSGQGHNQKN